MALPSRSVMMTALLERDASFEGLFVVGVKTTGIFCRPTCPARKPLPENVEFFGTIDEALASGFRPCKRCRPLEPAGGPPDWLRPLLEEVERNPTRRLRDADLRQLGYEPARVRRWFVAHHGMTFQGYHRARRLGHALENIGRGAEIEDAGYASGFESASGFREAFGRWFGETPARARRAQPLVVERLTTQLGPMVAAATDDALALLEFADRRMLETQIERLQRRLGCRFVIGSNAILERTKAELAAYFRGELQDFSVPLELAGTDFQTAAWRALLQIPYGATRSYEEQARVCQRPGAYRAIGRANGDNRLAIIVPCHRVIRTDGSLSGYGGGLWRKRWLLDHERKHSIA